MRHLQSLGHYGEQGEENLSGIKAAEEGDGAGKEKHEQSDFANRVRRKAWELYYQDLPKFEQIKELMQTFVPYCFRTVPTSPLASLALAKLQAETVVKRPVGLDESYCDCWALAENASEEGVWTHLQAAQESGAIQRQEAASMVPVMLLKARRCTYTYKQFVQIPLRALTSSQVQPHHFVADLCAAPASKTLQLLDVMNPGVRTGKSLLEKLLLSH